MQRNNLKGTVTHLYIAIFHCPIHDYQLRQVIKIMWTGYSFQGNYLNNA